MAQPRQDEFTSKAPFSQRKLITPHRSFDCRHHQLLSRLHLSVAAAATLGTPLSVLAVTQSNAGRDITNRPRGHISSLLRGTKLEIYDIQLLHLLLLYIRPRYLLKSLMPTTLYDPRQRSKSYRSPQNRTSSPSPICVSGPCLRYALALMIPRGFLF